MTRGGLRAGVAEDFPNGGGNRAYLFTVDGGGSAVPVAKLVVPVLTPKAFIPVHWDGLFNAFDAGVPKPYADAGVEALLTASGATVIAPAQYMDKWRLDRSGVRPVANIEVKKALGFR